MLVAGSSGNGFIYQTPLGKMVITENGHAITAVMFGESLPEKVNARETPLLTQANDQLQEYFIGQRKSFDLPLAPQGTAFQQLVWKALQDIPYGAVVSYQDMARAIGNAKACRAVGGANNRNPIAIVIPCHRVIGSGGSLVGYGGGLEIKRQLLELEQQ